jgi:hypothetical protein
VLRRCLPFALAVLAAVPLAAQTTGTPVFMAPYRAFDRAEFGASLSDPGPGFALEGFYRFGSRRWDVGVRGGFADAKGSDAALLVGADARTRVLDHTPDFPLDGALTLGVGLQTGNGATVGRVPVGVTFGRRVQLEDSEVQFVPYFHPVLAPVFGDTASDLDFALGLGVDVTIGRRFEIRVSGALGDYEGIGISFSFLR